MDMAIDFEQKFFDDLGKRLDSIDKRIARHNEKHERDLAKIGEDIRVNTEATEGLANHVATQNGRVSKLERQEGKSIPVDNKTVTFLTIAAIVFMVVIVGGRQGLQVLREIFT